MSGNHRQNTDYDYLKVKDKNQPRHPSPWLESFYERIDSLQPKCSFDVSRTTCITLRRRRMQCLDLFLGGLEVWVFCQDSFSHNEERLYLSTNIEALADLWGPMLRIGSATKSQQIDRYDIGNGSIVPWKANATNSNPESVYETQVPPQPQDSEVYCHCVASKNWDSKNIAAHQEGLPRTYSQPHDTLLIGSKDIGLNINEDCIPSKSYLADIKTKFYEKSALRVPGSDRPRRYADSFAVQAQGSILGQASIGGSITYKRRHGHNMKDVLVERWRNSRTRNPGELEAFCGVEVSLCTRNAKRVRLLELLGSDTMRKYLKGIEFDWYSAECEKEYFNALRSQRDFRAFWNKERRNSNDVPIEKDWRRITGDVISLCLDALQVTGVDEDNGGLSAFWADTFEDDKYLPPVEEWIVTLSRNEHTWTRFMHDSPEVLTMAVMDPRCFDINDLAGLGRRCRRPRPTSDGRFKAWILEHPVLETSLQLNKSLVEPLLEKGHLELIKSKHSETYQWKAHNLKKNTELYLGDQGRLFVKIESSCHCPPILSWIPTISDVLHEFQNVGIRENLLGVNVRTHHHENIRGTWTCKPLRVLVLSDSAGKGKE